jgi:hypothetical protein
MAFPHLKYIFPKISTFLIDNSTKTHHYLKISKKLYTKNYKKHMIF